MNRQKRYLFYFSYFLLTIPLVILIFKFIEPKKLASLFAATLFVSCSAIVFWGEIKYHQLRSFSFFSAVGFFSIFSAPMLVIRLLNYDLDFSEIYIWGIPGPDFHKYSNYGFWVLSVSSIVDYIRTKRPPKAVS